MATYIVLSRLTDEGRRTLKDRPERLEEVNGEIRALGGRVVQQHALLGSYDFISVIEAADNEAITRITTELGTRGTVRLDTLAAFPIPSSAPAKPKLPVVGSRQLTFAVFTKLTPRGRNHLRAHPQRLAAVEVEAARLGARITHQYRVLGPYDFITFVEAPDNATASRIAAEASAFGSVKLDVFPAIRLERFVQLLRMRTYRTEPHRWQTHLWAWAVRAVGRHWVMTRHVYHFCNPLDIDGRDLLRGVKGPAIIIANHTSHFDTPVVLTALPGPLRARTAVAAAADRFYRTNRRTWWFSLFWNTFPIQRGGGSKAIEYPMWLLDHGWSILIYPEGGRFRPGQLQRFHHGTTLLAMHAKVPVIPVYLDGLDRVMPKGVRNPKPGPVSVRLGAPVSLEGIEDVPTGTRMLEDAMRALAHAAPRGATAAAVAS